MPDTDTDADTADAEVVTETETHLGDGEGLEIAHPEDFGISRDDNGDVSPVKQRIPGTDMAIRCRPLVDGAIDRWQDVLEGANPDDDRVDEFLQTYVVEGVGQDGLQDIPDYVVPGIIEAVKRSSGYEVFQQIQEAQIEENLQTIQAMDQVPEGVLERVMDQQQGDETPGEVPPTAGQLPPE